MITTDIFEITFNTAKNDAHLLCVLFVCMCVCVCVCGRTQYPLTMLQLFVGDIYSLLNFMSFLRWTFIGLVVLGLIYLRFTKPNLRRPFKVS